MSRTTETNKILSQKFMMTSPHEGLKRKGWDISSEDFCTWKGK